MDPLASIAAADLRMLLALTPQALIGKVMELNREPRYANRLDALRITIEIQRMRHLLEARVGSGNKA